ncbi:hypothetical protein BZA77DRAFT_83791 [Pyronema omphalodes]|nr:hypothetical protein BZA77DRAFT_83791 [Pyronema omphalodes]
MVEILFVLLCWTKVVLRNSWIFLSNINNTRPFVFPYCGVHRDDCEKRSHMERGDIIPPPRSFTPHTTPTSAMLITRPPTLSLTKALSLDIPPVYPQHIIQHISLLRHQWNVNGRLF